MADKRAERLAHGETKNRYAFMLTETASEKIDEMAEKLGTTRSEILELCIRGGGLEAAVKYKDSMEV